MIQKRAQISVIAVAVLAIVAVAAVMLLAGGGGPAQADTATLAPDSGGGNLRPMQDEDPTATPTPTPASTTTPQQTEPEECLKPPAHVIAKGHYAVFDVFWDDDGLHAPVREKTLVNNPCPPGAEHGANEVTTRSASNIDIGQTIFHVRSGAMQTVTADSTADYAKYPFLYPSASGGDIGDPLSTKIWVLPSCEHGETPAPTADDLCVGFSAGLLKATQWRGDVQYQFESIREPGIEPEDRGEVFAFAELGDDTPFWATADTGRNAFSITPGTYEHLRWVFTKAGTYVFAVHVAGHPTDDLGLPSGIHAVTSEVQHYTFHVGKLANVGVALTTVPSAAADAKNTPLDPDDTTNDEATIKVTASNAGPDAATNTRVRVDLPEGLSYVSESTQTGSYSPDSTDSNQGGVWNVGNLAKGASATLDITVRVRDDHRGHPLKVTALIEAFEGIGGSTVVELDPFEGNNTARVAVIAEAIPNVPPMFLIERTLPVEYRNGDSVGAPILVKEPNNVNDDTTDTLTFSLSGQGADDFTVNNVDGSAQIVIDTPNLSSWHYHLKLHVSDGKDHFGNADASIDHSIAVRIAIPDVD